MASMFLGLALPTHYLYRTNQSTALPLVVAAAYCSLPYVWYER